MKVMILVAASLTFFLIVGVSADPGSAAEPDCWPCFSVQPGTIDYPLYGKPGEPVDVQLTLINASSSALFVREVDVRTDSTKPASLPGAWIGPVHAPSAINGGSHQEITIHLNPYGDMQEPGSAAYGRIIFTYGSPDQSDTVFIRFFVLDTVVTPRSVTVSTDCISLVVGTDGNMGRNGIGGANMNFAPVAEGGLECDTSLQTGRGDARVYLSDASPVILRKYGDKLHGSWALFQSGFSSATGLRPVLGQARDTAISTAGWDEFHSGTFVTADSLLNVEKTWFARKGSPEDCQYIIQRMRVFSALAGVSVPALTVAELVDWNVPTDTISNYNVGGLDIANRLVWMRGFDIADGAPECASNSQRWAGTAVLYIHTGTVHSLTGEPFAAYTATNIDMLRSGTLAADLLWDKMQVSGYRAEPAQGDLHAAVVYKNAALSGWTLPANDTLTIWTALAVTYQAENTAAGLDSLRTLVHRAKEFVMEHFGEGILCCCCGTPTRGNTNGDGVIDISDLAYVVAYLTDSGRPPITACSVNIDGSGVIDVSDLALLISYLTGRPRPTLLPCL